MAAYPGSVGYTPPSGIAPFAHAWVVDKSDSVPLPAITQAIYVGATGDVVVQMAGVEDGNPTTFAAVPAGTTLLIAAAYVMAASTSTNIVALW